MKICITLLIYIFILSGTFLCGQHSNKLEVKNFQDELNVMFADPEKSPLTEADRQVFHGLDFFPFDIKYQVRAKFIHTPGEEPFEMKTTFSCHSMT